MDESARDAYVRAQVMTASPQKMRLMLIEGAIRFASLARKHWEDGDQEQAGEALVRCRAIISELLAAIRPEASETAKRLVNVYLYLFRALTEIRQEWDAPQVDKVISVLEEERVTWRAVCDQVPREEPADNSAAAGRAHRGAAVFPEGKPESGHEGLCLDA
jgi:flagellar protein FliS